MLKDAEYQKVRYPSDERGVRHGPPAPGRTAYTARPAASQHIDRNQPQHRGQLMAPVGQWNQLHLKRRRQNPLHDRLETIQEATNGKPRKAGMRSF